VCTGRLPPSRQPHRSDYRRQIPMHFDGQPPPESRMGKARNLPQAGLCGTGHTPRVWSAEPPTRSLVGRRLGVLPSLSTCPSSSFGVWLVSSPGSRHPIAGGGPLSAYITDRCVSLLVLLCWWGAKQG